MDVGQGVDDREAIDFLVIFVLDVAAHEEAIDAVADAQIIAVLELVHGSGHVVDEGAVGALQIDGVIAVDAGLNAGVPARHGMIVDADVAIAAPAQHHGVVAQRIARAHAWAGRVNVHQTRIAIRDGNGTFGCRHPRFRYLIRRR